MKIRITQYNTDNSITPDAQLLFFIRVNEEYQTWNLTKDIFRGFDMEFSDSCKQFEYTTP